MVEHKMLFRSVVSRGMCAPGQQIAEAQVLDRHAVHSQQPRVLAASWPFHLRRRILAYKSRCGRIYIPGQHEAEAQVLDGHAVHRQRPRVQAAAAAGVETRGSRQFFKGSAQSRIHLAHIEQVHRVPQRNPAGARCEML